MKRQFVLAASCALAFAVAGCGGKPSAVQASGSQSVAEFGETANPRADPTVYPDRRDLGGPLVNGKPMWASNRTHTAAENAQYQFTKNGADFGAANENDYVAKAHAFIDHPPGDLQTVDRRNGDRLLYSASDNVFEVVSRYGAPRTMFKPRGGAAYWTQQKERESQPVRSGGAGGGGIDPSQG